jgi:anti-sigma B factor antagonist
MLTKERIVEGIVILDFEDSTLDLYSAPEFKETIMNLVNKKQNKIIMNLKNLTFIDSSGLGSLLFSNSHVRSGGGKLVFINLGGEVLKLFNESALYNYLEICDSESDAIKKMK